MNEHCTRWAIKLIEELTEPFCSMTLREKLVERHGTAYVVSNTSIGQFLAKNYKVVGKVQDRFLYTKRDINDG